MAGYRRAQGQRWLKLERNPPGLDHSRNILRHEEAKLEDLEADLKVNPRPTRYRLQKYKAQIDKVEMWREWVARLERLARA